MNVLIADTLLDTLMPGPAGDETAAVPAVRVGELLVYPRPVIRHNDNDGGGEPIELALDLRRWLISLPGGRSVPVECTTAKGAVEAARTFCSDAEAGAIGSGGPAELAKWAAWWCERRPDAVELQLGGGAR